MRNIRIFSCLSFETNRLTFEDFVHGRERLLEGAPLRALAGVGVSESLKSYMERVPDWPSRAEKHLTKIDEMNAQLTYPGGPDYPESLLHIARPPVALVYWGMPVWTTRAGISVVGSRKPCQMSLAWMETEFVKFLRLNDVYVISGAARGVDQKAHAMALRTGRPTVAILPSGLGNIYPPEFKSWVFEIVSSGGAVVTEYAIDRAMFKGCFSQRNRLISGMVSALFLVEAERKSGSVMTANFASEQNRELAVLPGHPGASRFLGGLDLLRTGATPVMEEKDLTEWFWSQPLNRRMLEGPKRQN